MIPLSRGQKRTHCRKGHPFTSDSIYMHPDGNRECRTCRREQKRRWARKNPDQHRENFHVWYRKGDNSERVREKSRLYYSTHSEQERERARRWAKANPEKNREKCRRRRALKSSQIGLWDSDSFIERQLWLYQEGCCFYCQYPISHPSLLTRDFHLDHCVPLSKKGLHDVRNVVLACIPCNLHKREKTAEEFLEQQRW